MCFLLFLEPSGCSPHAEVSRFLQPTRHLSRSCAFNLCKPLAIMSHSSTSFHLFFGLCFFVPSTSKCSAVTGPLFFIHSHHMPQQSQHLLSQKLFQSLYAGHFTNLLIVSFKVFPHIICNSLISIVFNLLSSSTFNAQHLAP